MTDSVVLLKDDKEIKEAYKRATSWNLSSSKIDVWSNRPALKLPQCILDTIATHQAETNRKLGRVLQLLAIQSLQEISGLSDYLRQLTTPLRTLEVTVITESRQPLPTNLSIRQRKLRWNSTSKWAVCRETWWRGCSWRACLWKLSEGNFKTDCANWPSPLGLFQWTDPSTVVYMLSPMTSVSSTAWLYCIALRLQRSLKWTLLKISSMESVNLWSTRLSSRKLGWRHVLLETSFWPWKFVQGGRNESENELHGE